MRSGSFSAYPDEREFEEWDEADVSGSFGPPSASEECDRGLGSASGEGREAGRRRVRPVAHPEGEAAARPPLRMIAVGPCLVRGGAEQWLINFARGVNPRRLDLVRTIVTNPRHIDPDFVADLPIPFEVGRSEAVQRAIRECDVLLGWGVGLDQFLGDERPGLCLFVAHGEGDWTRDRLRDSRRALDHVVAVSRRVAEATCRALPCSVIHNGVDSARLGQSRSRDAVRGTLGFAPGDFVLGYVGRFSGEKRVERIIQAAALLPERFKVLLVGWGGERHALMDLANRLIPGRFAFAAAAHYLGDFYQAMDAFCLVSNQEGYSLALLEAMMCGRPAIVTPVGSVPEIIADRINGVVVAGSPASIADAARLLRDHPHWARAVALEARAYAEEHGHAARMTRQYEDLIEDLWDRKQGRRAAV